LANAYAGIADFVADALDVAQTGTINVTDGAPLVSLLPNFDSADGGTTHKWNVRTANAAVGFRTENAGAENTEGTDSVASSAMKIVEAGWVVDKAVADRWRRGGAQAYIAREGLFRMRTIMHTLEKCCFYGTASYGVSGGFAGLLQSAYLDALADDMTIDAGGTTADTASSVWAVRMGFDDLALITSPIEVGDTEVIRLKEDGSDKYYSGYWTPAQFWATLQTGGKYSAGRICNLTADSGKGLTDSLMSDLYAAFPSSSKPTHAFMSHRSWTQLQKSRTATSPTGAEAPYPEFVHGMRLIVSDAIVNTEALET
jgi:hypothetical protein